MNFFELVEARRSYRYLKPVTITDEMIDQLRYAARLAPSCFNNQPWRYVFVKAPQKLQELQEAYSKGNVWANKASMVIAVYTKEELDCVVKTRKYYLFDTGMASAFIMLKATELGLVSHPIADFRPKVVKRILDIPSDMQVITLLIVGEQDPDKSEKPRPERLPYQEFTRIV